MTDSTKRKPVVPCDYCLFGKTTRIITTTDGEKVGCCKDCYQEIMYECDDDD
jgi:hypothetical protein